MLEKLPIQLPQFAPEQWRSLEEQLIAIANREKLELEPRDRIVHKALPMVQHAAKAKQWTHVFNELRSRGIIELKRGSAALLQFFTAQRMALCLTYKPVKVAKAKPQKITAKPIPKPKYKPCDSFLILSFLRWIVNEAKEHRLTRMFFQLTHEEYGYKRLRAKNSIKIGSTVREMLVLFSPRGKQKRLKKRLSTLAKKRILDKAFNQILTNKWQDTHTLYSKFCEITQIPMERSRFDDRLKYRATIGEIAHYRPEKSGIAYYSNSQDATDFESEWIDFNRAYDLAVTNGCKTAPNTFRTKPHKTDYTKEGVLRYYKQFGLEYRYEVPENENPLFKWRAIN